MTLQEIFTKVAAHLTTQNKRSTTYTPSGSTECLYRTPEGLSCAVGCLISDEHYSRYLEGQAVASQPVLLALSDSGIPINVPTAKLLEDLQNLHDYVPPHLWPEGLEEVAMNHNLEYTA